MSIFHVFLRLDNPLNMSAPRKTPWTPFLSFSYVGIDTKCHVPAQLFEWLFLPRVLRGTCNINFVEMPT